MTKQTSPASQGADSAPRTTESFSHRYADFLSSSPTSYHASQAAADRLSRVGFQALKGEEDWPAEDGAFFLRIDGALIAWIQFKDADGFSVAAAHTDSPALKLKSRPQHTTADGWQQLMVETYGGLLNNSWLDRELRIAGAVRDRHGNTALVSSAPIARMSQLAPHLGRSVNQDGVVLDPQKHMQPVWAVDHPEIDVMEEVARLAGLSSPEEILASELFLVPSEAPGFFGFEDEFLAAGRQDNLSSCFAGLEALVDAWQSHPRGDSEMRWPSRRMPVLALFDHEEIGSETSTGARSSLLPRLLLRVANNLGSDTDGFQRMLARTTLISVDAAHGVNPSYPEMHDPLVRPMLGRGPVLKVDADQRYATSLDGVAMWREVCSKAEVPNQDFVMNSSMRAGSTVGPALSTALGVAAVDVGIPLLAMHSTREMSHVEDPYFLAKAIGSYWTRMFTD